MAKMSAVPRPIAKKLKDTAFRCTAFHSMSLMLVYSCLTVCAFITTLWNRMLIEASQNQL